MRKHRIALIGCGRISHKHLEAIYQNRDRLELVALCDIDQTRKDSVNIDVPFYTSLESLVKEQDFDLVSLCTPSGLHPPQAIFFAEHGKHVITEKPMATRWQDGLAMIKSFDAAGKHLFVVKQNRLNPTVQLLKKAIDEHWFGKIYTIHSNVFWTRPQSYYDQDKWRGTWEFDGGALMNQASHYVDLLEWLGGPVECVQAMMATQARDIEVEDSVVVNMKWRRGAIGSMCVSMLTYPQNMEGSITILGEKGTVRLGGVALNSFEVWDFETNLAPSLAAANEAGYQTNSVYGNGHSPYYKNVLDALDNLDTAIADGREGLLSLELLIACYRSAQSKKSIYLPLEL
ncbi:Gfo/Idh/MocA family protein [Legionella shakespearei]|uniref:Myo-inositol-2-dehydrogenase n=1 Tax=Legionella shakespearei DSM 23087 TaxID=1122169 RepID=A0A0W0YV37_9GAMM|nr:Gfo/Idh/MocA family oxidoreductase [Legionella shakespearei]KTD60732.1 myo-inositol-2-dehydrogenase [Legionella shakespearei DSM 23087]